MSDPREQLRRYLEQRRELGERELTLDKLTVEEAMRIVGARSESAQRVSSESKEDVRQPESAAPDDWRAALRAAGAAPPAQKSERVAPPTGIPASTPEVGEKAYPSRTPTLASTHGRVAQLTTRVPPDRALLRYSVRDSLAAHVPFVLTFATPRWCSSRTCGPVVDVVDAAPPPPRGNRADSLHPCRDLRRQRSTQGLQPLVQAMASEVGAVDIPRRDE